jgi:hypothetical protein
MSHEVFSPMNFPSLPAHRLALRRAGLLASIAATRPGHRGGRRLVVAFAVFAVLAAAGTAVGLSTDFLAEQERVDQQTWPPAPTEYLPSTGRVEVARGPDWSVMAWRSAGGVCFAIAVSQATNWGRGCGPTPNRDEDEYTSDYLITLLWYGRPAADGLRTMAGAVTAEVASVDIVLAGGKTIAVRAVPAPETVGENVRLFVLRHEFATGGVHGWAYESFVFRDAAGVALERFTVERGAAGG